MIGALVIFFVIMWILTKDMRFSRKHQYLLEYAQTETITLIKFDGWTVWLLGVLTIGSVFAFLASVAMVYYAKVSVAAVFAFMFGVLFFILLAYWLRGKTYLSRVTKYGYEIPWHSRDYGFILENVPRTEVTLEQEPYNRRSKFFSLFFVYIWLCFLALNVWLCCDWTFIGGIEIFGVVLTIIDLYWLYKALQYRKQISNEEYKEDIEIDKYRKDRISLEKAIFDLVVMLLVFGGIKSTAFNYVDYVYRAQVEGDRQKVEEIHSTMEMTYRELVALDEISLQEEKVQPASEEILEDCEGIYQQLMEGVDITSWGIPQDAYQEKVAEYLGISDFSQLKEHFRSVKGEAVLMAQLEEGKLVLYLANLPKEVSRPVWVKSAELLTEESKKADR